jgi:hypothetical protein
MPERGCETNRWPYLEHESTERHAAVGVPVVETILGADTSLLTAAA